ncbi:hypothetical protein T265_14189 [Opisthorchis viverrini]|uniref:Exosome complex component CSL4 C-terminal domain-containing protein n=1 Tax=Opisthorchis viverrini TaxID=6198 RepID=A0A074ZQD1_OPIVI|nr:hypothetical protein T265_14189 [Opisthorchis viverrini]KER25540.1 hypothetical protein T265_14189 [Opisthorchis viverrini]
MQISNRTMFDKRQDIFFPGDSIVQKDDRHRCGPFTHISGGQIRASCMGRTKRCTSDGVTVVELVPLKTPGVVPYAGAIVLAKTLPHRDDYQRVSSQASIFPPGDLERHQPLCIPPQHLLDHQRTSCHNVPTPTVEDQEAVFVRPVTIDHPVGGEMAQWLEREFTDRGVRGSNLTSASRLPLSRLGQPGSTPALVLASGGMSARHRKGVTAERLFSQVISLEPSCLLVIQVSSLSRRIVRCDVVAVGNIPLAGPFRGMLRREDIRATQRDQAEPAQCYRPGDLIRARVINLLGPGSTPESTFLSGENVSSAAATTLLAARAVSVSVGATADISGGLASNAVCLLSTAEPDLGVVLGLGRAPDTDFAELLGSTSGCPLIPVSWTEMLCPHTLSRFPRKVARVSDELLTQLVKTEIE